MSASLGQMGIEKGVIPCQARSGIHFHEPMAWSNRMSPLPVPPGDQCHGGAQNGEYSAAPTPRCGGQATRHWCDFEQVWC
jgi:hypothetical protein